MNWLRRLIPWAFRHHMIIDLRDGGLRSDGAQDRILVRLICKRCGFVDGDYELKQRGEFLLWYHIRGCRGTP
ncbi:MAG: hypothetical protein V3S55_09770 [Nitrospiraceae bacterium]